MSKKKRWTLPITKLERSLSVKRSHFHLSTFGAKCYDVGMSGEVALSILRRLVESQRSELSPAAAEAILQLHLADTDQDRMSELASKSNVGVLTSAEAEEYDAYIAAADWLSLWKAKARLALKHHSSAA